MSFSSHASNLPMKSAAAAVPPMVSPVPGAYCRHQHPNPLLDIEITVVSAKHLKNVNWRNGDLKPYAVAYLDPDRRSATKPDYSGSTRPVWNERFLLPLPLPFEDILTLDVFHSKPSETPKPLVGTARAPLAHLLDLRPDFDLDDLFPSPAGPVPIKTLQLRRPSGRPQGKIRIKVALRERPMPTPTQEQTYHMPPPPPPAYYYSASPPPRDYPTYSPPQPAAIPHYSSQTQFGAYSAGGGYSDPYSGYYSSAGGGGGYYSTAPPVPPLARPLYYSRPPNYGGPSAPADYSPHYFHHQKPQQLQQRAKGSTSGMGTGLAVGTVAGTLGALALEEGIKYEEEKIAERVASDLATRDDYSDYRADY